MLPRPSHYDMLGIPQDADKETVLKAYRKLAFLLHPDSRQRALDTLFKSLEPDLVACLDQAWLRVSDAYETLRDPAERRQYDSNLTSGGIAESAEQKKINDDFCTRWDQFNELYEIQMAYAEIFRDPTAFISKSFKEKKELKEAEQQASKSYQLLLNSYVLHISKSKDTEADLTQQITTERQLRQKAELDNTAFTEMVKLQATEIKDLTQQLATERQLRQKAEQEKTTLTEKLRVQTSAPATPSFFSSASTGAVVLKKPSVIRKDFYETQGQFSLTGISLVFDTFQAASDYYLALVKQSSQNEIKISIPETRSTLALAKPIIPEFSVTINLNYDYRSKYTYSMSDNEKLTALFSHAQKIVDISSIPQIEWDSWKQKPFQRQPAPSKPAPYGWK